MVKKTYIIPTTLMVVVQQQAVIAASPTATIDTTVSADPEDFEVKGDRTRPSAYNVWNDDWSNN